MSKIVFITSRFPYPISKGDQLRVYFQLKSLSKENDIHLIAFHDGDVTHEMMDALSFCKSIKVFKISLVSRFVSMTACLFNGEPFQVGYFYSKKVYKAINHEIIRIKPDFIHCHLLRTAKYVRKIVSIHKSIDFMDTFSVGMKKRGDIEKNPVKKFLLMTEYGRLINYEREMFEIFDNFSIISKQDADFIDSPRNNEIVIVPNGVDFESFYPRDDEKKYDICFMGNMSYPPNVEAVRYTVEEIFPLLIEKKPEIKFLIAGANPSSYIKQLPSENIDIIEKFNHISDSIAMSKIMISPMVVSIGLQNKIIQAMAMKVPNVVSKSANKAVQAKHEVEILEADKPMDYVDAIIDLLDHPDKSQQIAENAYEFVLDRYNWDNVNRILQNVIRGIKL